MTVGLFTCPHCHYGSLFIHPLDGEQMWCPRCHHSWIHQEKGGVTYGMQTEKTQTSGLMKAIMEYHCSHT